MNSPPRVPRMRDTSVTRIRHRPRGRFSLRLAFIGVRVLNESGICVVDLAEAQLKAAVNERAAKVVVPLNHAKVGLRTLLVPADLRRLTSLSQTPLRITFAPFASSTTLS